MSGYYKPVEIGVCEEDPKTPDKGKWCYRMVTVPALTPPEELEEVALQRYLDKYDDTFVHHTWIQSVGEPIEMEEEDDIPTSEKEEKDAVPSS